MRKPKAYVASALGFSEAGRLFYKCKLIPMLERIGYEVIDPWVLTSQKLIDDVMALPLGPEKQEKCKALNKIIGSNNDQGIDISDVMVAVLDGPDVDSGTSSEVGSASAKKKTVFGYRGDFRQSGDNDGSIVNLQVEYFIFNSGGTISTSLKELDETLTKWYEEFALKNQ
jgi:hypothetical protein